MNKISKKNLNELKTEKHYRTVPGAIAELKALDNQMPISAAYIRRMAKLGVLPCHLIGKRLIVSIEDIISLYNGDLCPAMIRNDNCSPDPEEKPEYLAASTLRGDVHD